MAVIEGLEAFEKAQREDRKKQTGFGARLLLKDGDVARIRFATDGRRFVIANYHSVPTGRISRAGRPIIDEAYCGYDEGEDCEPHTRVGRNESLVRRLMNAYVWVYEITNASGTTTSVNAFRLLRVGGGKNGYLSTMLSNFLRKYSTLCDRDYEWRRTGATQDDTVYSLIPEDKGAAPKGLEEGLTKLPALEDVARGLAILDVGQQPQQGSLSQPQITERKPSSRGGSSLLAKLREKQQREADPEIGEDL